MFEMKISFVLKAVAEENFRGISRRVCKAVSEAVRSKGIAVVESETVVTEAGKSSKQIMAD